MTTNHNQQAIDFLTNAGIKMSVSYTKFGLHFADDTQPRDIYRITLSRNGKSIWFTFGQSIAKSSQNREEPTAYDLLASITKYDPDTFSDFCGKFGYDEDSRRAYKTYKAVVREWQKVSSFFTAEELEQLYEIN